MIVYIVQMEKSKTADCHSVDYRDVDEPHRYVAGVFTNYKQAHKAGETEVKWRHGRYNYHIHDCVLARKDFAEKAFCKTLEYDMEIQKYLDEMKVIKLKEAQELKNEFEKNLDGEKIIFKFFDYCITFNYLTYLELLSP